jgi:hypothetical protein
MCVENTAKAILSTEDRPTRHWLRFLADIGATHSFAWWDWRDPLPFLASAIHLLRRVAEKLNPFLHPARLPVPELALVTVPSADSTQASGNVRAPASADSDSCETVPKPFRHQD